jgi:hypothetical protein
MSTCYFIPIAFLAGFGGILYYVVLGFVPTILDTYSEVQSDTARWVTTGMAIVYAVATPFFGLALLSMLMLYGGPVAAALVALPFLFRLTETRGITLVEMDQIT